MFIDVTRYGGMRVQRLAIAAIAYLDAVEGGCAIHLIGGETLRVNEDPTDVEALCAPAPAVIEIDGLEATIAPPPAPPAEPRVNFDHHAAKRAGRGRHSR